MSDITKEIKERSRLTKEEWREYTKTVWSIANVSHEEHPAVFPVEIPHRLTKLFSFVGETVLDPFGGTGSTAVAALRLERNAVVVEQNPKYIDVVQNRCREEVGSLFVKEALQAVEGDSRDLSMLPDESVSLVITSPPYWDKADYGGNGVNIGKPSSYTDFLKEIKCVFAECFRVLVPGRKICIVTANVNQHTDHGLLTFPLAADFTMLLRELGFVMVNEIVWSKDGTGGKWGSWGTQRPIFGSYPFPPNFLFKNVHEYVVIFSKPKEKKTTGPKVRQYSELMGAPVTAREKPGGPRNKSGKQRKKVGSSRQTEKKRRQPASI